jgi:CubicO group peptidase (beta-lactamase class C family)
MNACQFAGESSTAPASWSRFAVSRRAALRGGARLALAAGGVGLLSPAVVRAVTSVADAWGAVSDLLAAAVDDRTVDGVGLVVVRPEETLYVEAFGAYTTETVAHLASATKLVSATAIMALVDDGLIDLDEPVATYLPAFAGDKAAITVRQLLAHTSGLPRTHPSFARPRGARGMTLAESVEEIAEAPLVTPPGSTFAYGECGFMVAGRVAEVVTDENWANLFAAQVAGRLGMTTFAYGPPGLPLIGGGGSCALADYANLLQMHLGDGVLQGRRILSEASVQEMRRDQLRDATFSMLASDDPREVGYGLGWWIDAVDHAGESVHVSDAGAFGTIPWLDLERGYAAFLLIQDRLTTGLALYDQIIEPVRQAVNA